MFVDIEINNITSAVPSSLHPSGLTEQVHRFEKGL